MQPAEPAKIAPFNAQAIAITCLAVVGGVIALKLAAVVVVPILVSVLLAYALEAPVHWLSGHGVPRAVGAIFIYALLAAAAVSTARTVRLQIDTFVDDLPSIVSEIRQAIGHDRGDQRGGLVGRTGDFLRALQASSTPPSAPAASGVRKVAVVSPPFNVRDYLVDTGMALSGTITQLGAIALLTFLLLATGDLYKRKFVRLAGPEQKHLTIDVVRTIDRQIQRYLIVRLLISVIVGVATGFGLWLVGLSHAAVWGAIAGVLNVLPFIGPAAAVALIALAALFQFRTLEMTAAASGVAMLVAALEGNLVTPWLTSQAAELNTVATFVSVLFWGWMWGVWGLLLAIPVMVGVKAAADHIEGLNGLGEFLGR